LLCPSHENCSDLRRVDDHADERADAEVQKHSLVHRSSDLHFIRGESRL
jgi:hypothetical protein